MLYGKVPGIANPAPRLLLGTMIVTVKEPERSFALLDDAFARGFTGLDTANNYAGGNSERCIGRWMEQRGNRDKIFILTKGAHPNEDRARVTPFDIAADLHDSLARLRTDHIDLYLLHRDDESVPVGPIVETLNEHHAAGRVRAFGGSNWTHRRLAEANDYAAKHGLVPFAASSPNYSLAVAVQQIWPGCLSLNGPDKTETRDWYRRTQMPIFAWSSLGRGFFSGRLTRANFEQVQSTIDAGCRRAFCHEVNFQRLDRVEQLAQEKGASVPQVALAWVLHQPLNVFALVGAAGADELDSNLAALDLTLSPSELAWLNLESDARAARGSGHHDSRSA